MKRYDALLKGYLVSIKSDEKILREQAKILSEINGETVVSLLQKRAVESPSQIAYVEWSDGERQRQFSWKEVYDGAKMVARQLQGFGLKPKEIVLLQMPTTAMHAVADLGILLAGGVPCGLYFTAADEQMAAIAQATDARFAIAETKERLSHLKSLDGGGKISGLVLSPDTIFYGTPDIPASIDPSDCATLIFTSGTTGQPKGIPLSHENILFASASIDAGTASPEGEIETYLSYLPLTHIAEREMSIYLPLLRDREVNFLSSVEQLALTLQALQPHCFFGTPRVFEKLMEGLMAQLKVKNAALVDHIEQLQNAVLEQVVADPALKVKDLPVGTDFYELRAALGLANAQIVASGSAYMPKQVAAFFVALGLPLTEGYGLTETVMVATYGQRDDNVLGSIGKAMPGMEIKLSEDGEILIRSPSVFKGYFGGIDSSGALDADGWFFTGDLGRMDEDGNWYITGRRKEIIITSSGKNIAPEPIEAALAASPLIEYALVVGEGRSYLNALLVLSEAGQIADPEELAGHVVKVNNKLSRIEQIKNFHAIRDNWTPQSGFLTPTLKFKRSKIVHHYQDVIGQMYQ